jgi:hypothetical protein
MRIYAEFGIGNETFLNTEFEKSDGTEYRVPSFVIPDVVDDIYIRIWIVKFVLILSTKDGIKIGRKNKNKFKILFGIGGR